MGFTAEQHEVWQALFLRQLPNVRKYACREYLEGFDILGLPSDRLPTLEELNGVITPRTGWRVRRTPVRYSDSLPWYSHFARRTFLITGYIRKWEELDFTPEPDLFHDIFGHPPFMVLPEYAALQDSFASAYLRTDPEHREQIKRLVQHRVRADPRERGHEGDWGRPAFLRRGDPACHVRAHPDTAVHGG